jgi:transposase
MSSAFACLGTASLGSASASARLAAASASGADPRSRWALASNSWRPTRVARSAIWTEAENASASLAARRVVTGEGLSLPRGGGRREQLRILLVERRGATRARTAALNQLEAVIVTAPDDLRRRLASVPKRRLVRTAARLRPRPDGVTDVLRRIARRVESLSDEITEIDRSLSLIVTEIAPQLLAECGVGAVCAAQLLVSSGDHERMASEASFAALAGTSPIDASSGKQQRHRLNRGGDRQLNWAVHVITLQRVHYHAETAAYYQRLLAAGKTTKEAKRCVKRALARHFYHQLRGIQTPHLTT